MAERSGRAETLSRVNLGGGLFVPSPHPRDAAATKIGKANGRTGNRVEVVFRSELHRRGLRFRKDLLIRCSNGVKVHVDVAFTRQRFAIFVDGCFWHCCPEHCHMPKTNVAYWSPKLAANVARDRKVDAALEADGWCVRRIWEHEDARQAADRIADLARPSKERCALLREGT
jgi:DNA mismatch endonuclease (patch repair protein)